MLVERKDGVDADELAVVRVVFASPDMGQSCRFIGGFAEECLVVGPDSDLCTARAAERRAVAFGDGVGARVQCDAGGAVVVASEEAELRAGNS